MNLLIDNTPDYIMVGGKKIPIKTDFKLWAAFWIACAEGSADKIKECIGKITDDIPEDSQSFAAACITWMFPDKAKDGKKTNSKNIMSRQPFDFAADGNIIYCELWQYFPTLMERGISFHEGMELIKILLHNESTMMWHIAFARCGDFSKMEKSQRDYWQRQRQIYSIANKAVTQEDRDRWLYNAF